MLAPPEVRVSGVKLHKPAPRLAPDGIAPLLKDYGLRASPANLNLLFDDDIQSHDAYRISSCPVREARPRICFPLLRTVEAAVLNGLRDVAPTNLTAAGHRSLVTVSKARRPSS